MNMESTTQRQKNLQNVDCQEHAIENKDMSADPLVLPVFRSIVHGQHKAMFANTQLTQKDHTYKNIRPRHRRCTNIQSRSTRL